MGEAWEPKEQGQGRPGNKAIDYTAAISFKVNYSKKKPYPHCGKWFSMVTTCFINCGQCKASTALVLTLATNDQLHDSLSPFDLFKPEMCGTKPSKKNKKRRWETVEKLLSNQLSCDHVCITLTHSITFPFLYLSHPLLLLSLSST